MKRLSSRPTNFCQTSPYNAQRELFDNMDKNAYNALHSSSMQNYSYGTLFLQVKYKNINFYLQNIEFCNKLRLISLIFLYCILARIELNCRYYLNSSSCSVGPGSDRRAVDPVASPHSSRRSRRISGREKKENYEYFMSISVKQYVE